jgi:hypothetical protein
VESAPPVPVPWQTTRTSFSTAGSFAYAKNHPATPLPATALAMLASTQRPDAGDVSPFDAPQPPIDTGPTPPPPTQGGLCSTIAAVARANDLPVTFFANLIWQESSFRSRSISSAGALGIAQFTPETATERGLLNPFEPVHALFTAGKHLRRLHERFGNLGLAAAAYNAGPQRIANWMAERGPLPAETRDYVVKITGRPARDWLSNEIRHDPEAALMPPRAPCAEVAEEVREQTRIVRVARLMRELAAATVPPEDEARKAALQAWNKIKTQTMQIAIREFARLPAEMDRAAARLAESFGSPKGRNGTAAQYLR